MKKAIATAAWDADLYLKKFTLLFWFFLLQHAAFAGEATNVSTSECSLTSVQKSSQMIRAVLDDVTATYSMAGGGGISEVRQIATDIYRVSLPQEERIDLLTYSVNLDAKCKVSILKKDISAHSP